MSNFPDSFTQAGDESAESVHNYDVYGGYGESQGFDSVKDAQDVFESEASIYGNGGGLDEEFGGSGGPILPPQSEMEPEEGFALREWRRQNAMVLEEKEKKEKEMLSQIIDEAEQYKVEFYKKRETTCENNKTSNREKEKLFTTSLEKFYAEADKDYWKAIAELIPREIPTIEKRGKKKDQEKQPSVQVVQGPKPGKPTDLTRMRQILLKLKHDSPSHLKHSPPPPAEPAKDANAASTSASVAAAPEAVVAA